MIHDGLDEIIGWDESLLEWMHNYLNESPPWEHYEWFNHPNFWFLLTSRSLKLTHRTKTHTHTKTHTPCNIYTRTHSITITSQIILRKYFTQRRILYIAHTYMHISTYKQKHAHIQISHTCSIIYLHRLNISPH